MNAASRFQAQLRGDRGAATTQLVLVVPLLLTLMLLIVQFALAWHAQHIAQTAAARALGTARAQHGTASDGRQQAQAVLHTLASRVLTRPSVSVQRSQRHVSVRIAGDVISVIPGVHLHAHGQATGPVDRWTPGG